MSSYVKDSTIERTVYLTNAGSPVTGVLPAQVVIQYKKAGQTAFQSFVENTTNWLELGGGYYTLIFGPSETNTLGTFIYTATGGAFDNQIFEQLNIIDDSVAGDQQAYFQDAATERTIFLSLSGTAATAIAASSVVCKIKKSGQIGFTPKVLTTENWVNLGSGYYTIKFAAEDMGRVGTFVYTLTGSGFDNFGYDEFTVLAAPDKTIEDKCIVSGQFIGLAGANPGLQIRVSARPVEFPAKSGNRVVVADDVSTYLDHEGKFELPLLRGSTCIIEVPRAAIRHQIEIPDQASADLMDLLPPFAVDYSL